MKWWSLFPAMTSLNVITLTLRQVALLSVFEVSVAPSTVADSQIVMHRRRPQISIRVRVSLVIGPTRPCI